MRRTIPNITSAAVEVTSPVDGTYNCVAWSACVTNAPWWPSAFEPGPRYWPPGVPEEVTLQAFEAAFETLGFKRCGNEELEEGVEKIAVFEATPMFGPAHTSRQLPDGRWASKMGPAWDIVHDTNRQLEGGEYGDVRLVMARPRQGPPPHPPA